MIRLQRKKILWSGFEFKNFNILNFDKKLNNLNVGLGRNDNQIENLTKKYGFSKK